MKKINERQKKLIISKLTELLLDEALVARYEKDGDEAVSDKEWESARRKVVKKVLSNDDTRLFTIAPLLDDVTQKSPIVIMMYDYRALIAVVFILLGIVMILTDPGTFAARGETPFEWGENGAMGQARLLGHWLNFGTSGWGGIIAISFGAIWGKFARLFFR